jgi:5'-3' exonuclease
MKIPGRKHPYRVLIVDGSQFLWRAVSVVIKYPKENAGFCPAGQLFIKMLLSEIYNSGARMVLFCWEAESHWKQGIQGYKVKTAVQLASRPRELKIYENMLREFLPMVGVWQSYAGGYEADEVIALHCHHYSQRRIPILVVSRDHDFQQLTALDGVHVRVPIRPPVLLTRESITQRYGVGPEFIPTLWSLAGDSSDRLKGTLGIGMHHAVSIVQEWGAMSQWIDDLENRVPTGKITSKMLGQLLMDREGIKERYKLVDLLTPPQIDTLVVLEPEDAADPGVWLDAFAARSEEYHGKYLALEPSN